MALKPQDKLEFRVESRAQVFDADHTERLLWSESDCTASLGYCKKPQCLHNPVKTDRRASLEACNNFKWQELITQGVFKFTVQGSHVLKTVMSPIVPSVQGFEFSVWFFQ